MTFISDESSVESSRPREGIELILPSGEAFRIATGTRDITIAGEVYTARPAQRGAISVAQPSKDSPVTVTMPAASPFAERYLTTAPRRVDVNIRRKQAGGDERIVWRGYIAGATLGVGVIHFAVPSRVVSLTDRRLPVITVGRSCPHILYDSNCRVARTSFRQVTTIASFEGRIVTVASMGAHPDGWATYGELLHVASGERMTVFEQAGTKITLQLPIAGIADGDSVEVYAGCDHDIATCATKFSNVANFGGMPNLPRRNVFDLSGYGVYSSEE